MMKRIRFFCASVFAMMLFASCSKDAVKGGYISFRIDPSTVIESFNYELNPGELETESDGYKLRMRLLIYDGNSKLVASETQYVDGYASVMNSSITLPEGTYTAVALSDVVGYEDSAVSFEFWTLSNEDNLSTMKLADTGYIADQFGIVGIKSSSFTVTDSDKSISLNLKPAGALALVWFSNIHYNTNLKYIYLKSTTGGGTYSFSESGSYTAKAGSSSSSSSGSGSFSGFGSSSSSNSYNYAVCYIEPQNSAYASYSDIYSYEFLLPASSCKLKFTAATSSKSSDLGSAMTIAPSAGDEYLFYADMSSGYTYGLINGTTRSASVAESLNLAERNYVHAIIPASGNRQVAYIKDIAQ